MDFAQQAFDIRCEWGEEGMTALAATSDAVVIIDVLSFSTCVDIAVTRGAAVIPYQGPAAQVAEFAVSVGAQAAAPQRSREHPSLSPQSLLHLPPNIRLVLPSHNGSRLALAGGSTPVLAGCLRNARAVARAARRLGPRIALIPAGERWQPNSTLRPAVEDWLGAGAIIHELPGSLSPEACAARAAFLAAEATLEAWLQTSGSGQELAGRGFAEDVHLAAQLNVSALAPLLTAGAFVPWESRTPRA